MSGMAASLFPPTANRWDPATARQKSGRDEVILRSHLVGSDPALTKEGGGNFSAKGTVPDHRGIETRVLWMSAWGCDGASTTADDFPALRLDDLGLLRNSGTLSDGEMVDYLVACGLRGEQRRPGIETLTHAFIPAAHVDHCHPDAVIALTSIPDGKERAAKEFGGEAIWFDYRQFDVDVARELADRIAADPRCRFVLLANHGLFTWADTSEQCYRNSIEAVTRATRALGGAICRPADLGGPAVLAPSAETATEVLAAVLPAIRGALFTGATGVVLHVDRSAAAIEFASSARGPQLSEVGPGCPDHLVTVGYRPLVLAAIGTAEAVTASLVPDGIDRHRRWYEAYYERNVPAASRALGRRSDAPHVIVLPGIGVVAAGVGAAKARLCSDHFRQTMTVIRAADAAGGYASLSEAQGAADEYWPLMRLKPQLRQADDRLVGRVILLVGPDEERTVRVADRLAALGAHIAVAGGDHDRIALAAADIAARHGERRAVALPAGLGKPDSVVRDAVLAYGGFDVLLDMTPSGGLAQAALPVFERQGRGGRVLLACPERGIDELRAEVAALAASHVRRGVTVNAVALASPDAVAEAAMFFGGPTGGMWCGTVLEPGRL
jgi:rhamnose utilization protein RhaD (predicted bifunctional aldolase and dehydrogenase)